MLAQHRRARLAVQTGATNLKDFGHDATFDRLQNKVQAAEALGEGQAIAARELNAEQRLNQLEKSDQVDQMLADLKNRMRAELKEPPTFLKQLRK